MSKNCGWCLGSEGSKILHRWGYVSYGGCPCRCHPKVGGIEVDPPATHADLFSSLPKEKVPRVRKTKSAVSLQTKPEESTEFFVQDNEDVAVEEIRETGGITITYVDIPGKRM